MSKKELAPFEQFLDQNCTILPHHMDVGRSLWLTRYDRTYQAGFSSLFLEVEETKFTGDHMDYHLDIRGKLYVGSSVELECKLTNQERTVQLEFSLAGGIYETPMGYHDDLELLGPLVRELLNRPLYTSAAGVEHRNWSEKEMTIWRLAHDWINPAYNFLIGPLDHPAEVRNLYSVGSFPNFPNETTQQIDGYMDYVKSSLSVLFRNAIGTECYEGKSFVVPIAIARWLLGLIQEINKEAA